MGAIGQTGTLATERHLEELGDDPAEGGGPEQQETATACLAQRAPQPRHPVVQEERQRHDRPQREVPNEPHHATPAAVVDPRES